MDPLYKDPAAPIESRIRDLLSKMTLKEKVGQMTQIERRVIVDNPTVLRDFDIGTRPLSVLSAFSLPMKSSISSIVNAWDHSQYAC